MRKKIFTKTVFIILFIISSINYLLLAQKSPPPPPSDYNRGVGPGAPSASPIDMYQIVLFAVAIMLVAYFYKKTKLAKA